jgi:3-hydroxyisobutyrate dehydrogenase
MGANMARRLHECGYSISAIYDLNTPAAAALAAELGSGAAGNLAEVTAAAEVILTVVTDDAAMRQLFLPAPGADTLLTAAAAGKCFINCATLSPSIHREVQAAAQAVGAETLEACMASSISQAREGKLYLMLGGERSVYEQQLPLLEKLSVSSRYIGPTGRAAEVKALVNMVMNMNTAALAEGLGLAAALGHDLAVVREVFAQTGANSRVLETDAADMVAREHDCWFSAEHAAKDSSIAHDLSAAAGLHLPVNAATLAQYQEMIARGLGQLDKSGIAELTFPGRSAQA